MLLGVLVLIFLRSVTTQHLHCASQQRHSDATDVTKSHHTHGQLFMDISYHHGQYMAKHLSSLCKYMYCFTNSVSWSRASAQFQPLNKVLKLWMAGRDKFKKD